MYLLLAMALAVLFGAFSASFASLETRVGPRQDQGVLAGQMVAYHAAAARVCTTTPANCSAGTALSQQTVATELPSFRRSGAVGRGPMGDGTFASFVVSQAGIPYVVTYVSDPLRWSRHGFGDVRSAMMDEVAAETGSWIGEWSRSRGSIEAEGLRHWIRQPEETDPTYAEGDPASYGIVHPDVDIVVPSGLSAPMPEATAALVTRL